MNRPSDKPCQGIVSFISSLNCSWPGVLLYFSKPSSSKVSQVMGGPSKGSESMGHTIQIRGIDQTPLVSFVDPSENIALC